MAALPLAIHQTYPAFCRERLMGGDRARLTNLDPSLAITPRWRKGALDPNPPVATVSYRGSQSGRDQCRAACGSVGELAVTSRLICHQKALRRTF
ncbi:MAG: hypothetical protein JWL65_1395 [Gammaproteobacteria bacterium]|nr:hypothetical protein [Gammaproteobacteria bacterium]